MARTRYISYCRSCNKVFIEYMCVSQCITAPVTISGQYHMLTFQLLPVKMLFSDPCTFTKQARAAAAWQCCKEKLLKVNFSTEEAVYRAIQRVVHQPLPSHSKVPRAPHQEVSSQPLSLQNKCLALWHFSSWYSHMAWRLRGNFFHSLHSQGSLVMKCWVLDIWSGASWRKAAALLLH